MVCHPLHPELYRRTKLNIRYTWHGYVEQKKNRENDKLDAYYDTASPKLITVIARIFRIEKKNWGKKVPLIKGSSLKMASIVTCYTEKYETVLETCVSLFKSAENTQKYIDINVKNIVICVCR